MKRVFHTIIFFIFLILFSAFNITSIRAANAASYIYDAGGQRIARIEEAGEHTYYISPGLEVTVKSDGTKTWRKTYTLAGNTGALREGSSTNSTGTVYYAHADHLGSTALVTASNGTAAAKQRYFPYGTTKSESGDLHTDREYTGQISDQDTTGLYYYNARYYDPLLAKFTQADTANDGLNRYAYVANNPVNGTDPTGNTNQRYKDKFIKKNSGGDEGGGFPDGSRPQCLYGCHNTSNTPYNPGVAMSEDAQIAMANAMLVFEVTAGAYIVGGPVFGEMVDTTLCAAQGGGPGCVNLLPGSATTNRADDIADYAPHTSSNLPPPPKPLSSMSPMYPSIDTDNLFTGDYSEITLFHGSSNPGLLPSYLQNGIHSGGVAQYSNSMGNTPLRYAKETSTGFIVEVRAPLDLFRFVEGSIKVGDEAYYALSNLNPVSNTFYNARLLDPSFIKKVHIVSSGNIITTISFP